MKTFIAIITMLFVLSFLSMGQEMKSPRHHVDSTKAEKIISQKQHKDAVKIIKYTCTMHPEVISDKPGKCPKCRMTLVKVKKDK